jgi:type I restriction enzyme S subunit
MSSDVAELIRDADEVPDSWREVVLSDVADVNPETLRASTPPDFTFGYIDISQIDSPGQCSGWTEQSFGDAPSRARRRVQIDDILVSTVRPYLRSFAQVPSADIPLVASTGFAVIRAGPEADQQFLYQHILHSSFIDHLTPRMTGSNYPAVSAGDVEAYPILLPPLDEQRRIAEMLRSVDEAIAATQAVYEAAIAAQASAFETFLRSGNDVPGSAPVTGWTTGKIDGVHRLPAGWHIVKLVDVARLESGHTPDRKKPEYWDDGDIEWISLHDTQNLERCDISETDMRITQAGLANSSARLLPPGTVCFSRTATVGKCVIMAKSMATSQDFANFICSPRLNNRYLLHLMRWMQPVWKALASGSTHKTIYMPTFKALQIVLPSRAEQDGIAATLDSFVSVLEGHAGSLARLRSIKAAVMSDLLSGRVRVPV